MIWVYFVGIIFFPEIKEDQFALLVYRHFPSFDREFSFGWYFGFVNFIRMLVNDYGFCPFSNDQKMYIPNHRELNSGPAK